MATRRGYAALILTTVIWGSTFIVTKLLLEQVAPLQLTLLRFVIAFIVLAPLAARQGFHFKDIFKPVFLLFGLTGTTLYFAFQNLGMNYTSVTSTSLILAIVPVLTSIFAVIFLKEKLTRQLITSIGLVTVGMILVALSSGQEEQGSNPLLGNLLIFASGLAWAVYTIQGRKMSGDYPALVMTAASTGAGVLFLLPFAGWEAAVVGLPHFNAAGVAEIVYLGLAASALTMFLWNYALHYLPASIAITFVNLTPVIGVASGYILGENPPVLKLVGGALAIAGVFFSSRGAKPAAAEESQ